MKYEIIPSILVENEDEFTEKIEMAEDFAETVHWDIMDGQFVESTSFRRLKNLNEMDTVLSLGVHLMVEDPEELLPELAAAGIDRVVAHAEAADDLDDLVSRMKKYDFEVGLAINPETDIEEIHSVLDDLDLVVVMTVVPGAGGQKMLPETLDKVKQLRQSHPNLNIEVDGGVNLQTIKLAKEAGANFFGVNSAIFESPDPVNAFEVLNAIIQD